MSCKTPVIGSNIAGLKTYIEEGFNGFLFEPSNVEELRKTILKFYKKVQKQISNLKSDLEEDIGTEEIKKDVFNEMRMEELDLFDKSDKK